MTQSNLSEGAADILSRVANKLRLGQVILWTGSGFNYDAGLPMGADLANRILESCGPTEKAGFASLGEMLPDVAERFVDLRAGSRHELMEIVRAALAIKPRATTIFDLLTDIPQLKYVITTNYDRCVENAYGPENISVAYDDKSLAMVPHDAKTAYYKIHGDIDHEILITRTDYNGFFADEWNPLLFNAALSLATRYHILFLGYSHTDPNVRSMFDKLVKSIGDLARECYFVSPDSPLNLSKYPITAIAATATDAVQYLRNEVINNLVKDTNAGFVPPNAAIPLLRKHFPLQFNMGVDDDGEVFLKSFGPGEDGFGDTMFSFKVKGESAEKLEDFHQGNSHRSIEIPDSDIVEFSIVHEELCLRIPEMHKMIISKGRRLEGTIIGAEPPVQLACDIELQKSGDESLEMNVTSQLFTANFQMQPATKKTIAHFSAIRPGDPFAGVQMCRFLLWWMSGGMPTFIASDSDDEFKLPAATGVESEKREFESLLNAMLHLCNVIIEIMVHYGVRLVIPEEFSEEDAQSLEQVENAMRGDKRAIDNATYQLSLDKAAKIVEILSKPGPFQLVGTDDYVEELFGKKIVLGKVVVEATDAYVSNAEDAKKEIKENKDAVSIIIESESNQLMLSFIAGDPPKAENEPKKDQDP